MFLLWLRPLPWCANQIPASGPPPTVNMSSPTNTPVFPPVPLSCWVLRGSIYSFPLVRYSCPLSAGFLHALLCLMVYSWCIHGERCTPCAPTPPSSCFLASLILNKWFDFVSRRGCLYQRVLSLSLKHYNSTRPWLDVY